MDAGSQLNSCVRRCSALVAIAFMCVSLAACAPEPGDSSQPSGKENVAADGTESESWPEPPPEDVSLKSTEVPASFPQDAFPQFAEYVIDDIGERSAGQWYLVVRSKDAAAANSIVDALLTDGGFAATDDAESDDGGRFSQLEGNGLVVASIVLPASADDEWLTSFDISLAD